MEEKKVVENNDLDRISGGEADAKDGCSHPNLYKTGKSVPTWKINVWEYEWKCPDCGITKWIKESVF